MRLYRCWVHVNGGDFEVEIRAPNELAAKSLLESQYGARAVFGYPQAV